MTLYLSRLTLSRDPGNAALSGLLDPPEEGQAMNAHHRLMWTLFGDVADRRRDFLWRLDRRGRFFALSLRPPTPHPLFETPEVKEFTPNLSVGDRLSFVLRANATRDIARATRNRRVDLVMDLLRTLPKADRATARPDLAQKVASDWLARQGSAHGFAPEALEVEQYRAVSVPRQGKGAKSSIRLGLLDLAGMIRVTDPAAFNTRLAQGFGRARAFGCGLMLIRRAG